MARTRTLTNLIADVRWQADAEGFTDRHTDAAITRAINQSIQEFRLAVSDHGSPYYLSPRDVTITAGAATGRAYTEIDISAVTDLVRIYAIDVTVDDRQETLRPVHWEQRNDWQSEYGNGTGTPQAWFSYSTGVVGIVPAADRQYSSTLWILPTGNDLSAGADTFDGIAGWEEWVVFNVLVKLWIRDQRPEDLPAAIAERDRLLGVVLENAPRRQNGGAMKRHDVRGRHAMARQRIRWPRP